MNLADHPTVKGFYANAATTPSPAAPPKLDADWLRQLCGNCGADDLGLVEIGRPALDDRRDDILRFFPATKTLLSFVCRMNREPVRGTFTLSGDENQEATVVIRDKTVRVSEGHVGSASLRVTADSRWWLGFLANERNLLWGLLRRRLRLKGSPKLLLAFGKCFPS
jgi:hypothetical protein